MNSREFLASHILGDVSDGPSAGFEIGIVTDDVDGLAERAISLGGTPVKAPEDVP